MIEPNNNQEDKLHPRDGRAPLVILKPGAAFVRFTVVSVIAIICFCIFSILLPVFLEGSFIAVKPGDGIEEKIGMFGIASIAVPYGLFVLFLMFTKYGDYYFFNDYLAFISYTGRNVEMPYSRMYVILKGKQRLFISLRNIRDEQASRMSRWQRIRNWYNDIMIGNLKRGEIGTGIDQSKSVMRVWDNYDDLVTAQRILREKAFSFTEE